MVSVEEKETAALKILVATSEFDRSSFKKVVIRFDKFTAAIALMVVHRLFQRDLKTMLLVSHEQEEICC